jgi:hypothetical protein
MNSPLALIKPIDRGSATVMVLIAIMILAIIGAGLVGMQKNLYSTALKIENEQMQMDISDYCVQEALKDLRAKSLTNTLNTTSTVTLTMPSPMSVPSFSSVTAPSSRKQYETTVTTCSYRFILQRAIQGSVAGGEVSRTRSYVNTDGIEKVYEINALTCDGASPLSCRSVKTETKIYVGVQ